MRSLVLVVGAAGQLGGAMVDHLSRRHEVVALTRRELDIRSAAAVSDQVRSVCPDIIINCAAYNQVDAAETDPIAALDANAWGVRTLARMASDIGATFVHYSTDFVFDGRTNRPYTESDAPNPQSAYGRSKLLGEWFAEETPAHYVLRVESLFGGPQAKSSIDRILDAIRAGREVRAFVDRTVSPSFVDDVVLATEALLDRGCPHGLYHCVNSGWTNWADLARELAALAGRPEAAIVDVRMADAGLTASRPQYAALSNAMLAEAGVPMPTWQDALARYVGGRSPFPQI
jgi:dTDP-4-dehydrorhamnose reductase